MTHEIENIFKNVHQSELINCCNNPNYKKVHLYQLGNSYRVYCSNCHAIVDSDDYNDAINRYKNKDYNFSPLKEVS